MAMILVEINGERSEMDESLLFKRWGMQDDEYTRVDWVEYYLPHSMLMVHRSAHATVHKLPPSESAAGHF
jgi:hypothetical protein